jgi:hypothetical protein
MQKCEQSSSHHDKLCKIVDSSTVNVLFCFVFHYYFHFSFSLLLHLFVALFAPSPPPPCSFNTKFSSMVVILYDGCGSFDDGIGLVCVDVCLWMCVCANPFSFEERATLIVEVLVGSSYG